MADDIRCATADGVATVILNRPEKRNALNRALLDGLTACFARLEDDPAVRVVVVRGAGPAFCAGMDLDELARRQAEAADPESPVVAMLRQIERSRHPTIAMVHGDAFAGGWSERSRKRVSFDEPQSRHAVFFVSISATIAKSV